jgi:purine-binding chemotaxis protein CheW
MSTDAWGNDLDDSSGGYNGLFAIRKSLDGEQSAEFVDKMQFIGIKIAGEGFLLSIDYINEIIMLPNITYVPNCAKYIEGVVNLRGTILPVVNLRKMMGMSKGDPTAATRIIICKEENLNVRVGLLVDNITFVVALLPDEVDSSSPPSAASGHEMLNGVSKHGSSVSGVLDLQKILSIASGGKALTTEEEGSADDHAA